jgi:hypothetical protein
VQLCLTAFPANTIIEHCSPVGKHCSRNSASHICIDQDGEEILDLIGMDKCRQYAESAALKIPVL